MTNDTVLAIDFGTSNSLVGAYSDGKILPALSLDPTAEDPSLLRTLLYFPDETTCFYGHEAIREYLANDLEGRLFRSFKSHLPNQQYLGTVIGTRIWTLENMVGLFLLEMKKRAETFLGHKVTKAIVGRPARYSMDAAKDEFALVRMRRACEFAGFTDFRFVPEPLAAAFDYQKKLTETKLVLIGDFGGGTSDFTLIRLAPKGFKKEDVLSIEGCPLAGDAFDSTFMTHRLDRHFGAKAAYQLPMSSNLLRMPPLIAQRLQHPAHIVHLTEKETFQFLKEVQKCAMGPNDKMALERLFTLLEDQQIFSFFEAIERTKKTLSHAENAHFHFDYPGLEMSEEFTASEFFDWSEGVRQPIFSSLDRCFELANVSPAEVDLVCLTGGTAKTPFIREEFVKRFGEEKLLTQSHFHSVLGGLSEAAKLWSEQPDSFN